MCVHFVFNNTNINNNNIIIIIITIIQIWSDTVILNYTFVNNNN